MCLRFGFDPIPYGSAVYIAPKVPALYFWWPWLRIVSTLQENYFLSLKQTPPPVVAGSSIIYDGGTIQNHGQEYVIQKRESHSLQKDLKVPDTCKTSRKILKHDGSA